MKICSSALSAIIIFVSAVAVPDSLIATPSAPQPAPTQTAQAAEKTPKEVVLARKQELALEMGRFKQTHGGALPANNAATQEISRLYDEALLGLDQQLNELDVQKAQAEELERLRSQSAQWSGEGGKPVAMTALDDLKEKLRQEQASAKLAEGDLEKARVLLQEAEAALAKAEAGRRLAAEKASDETGEGAELTTKQAALVSAVAGIERDLRKTELAIKNQEAALSQLRMQGLDQRIQRAVKHVVFERAELDERLLDLDRKSNETDRAIEAAKLSVKALEQKWLNLKGQVLSNGTQDKALEMKATTYQRARELKQIEVASLTDRLKHYRGLKRIWQRRFDVFTRKATEEERKTWAEEAQADLDQSERDARVAASQLDELRHTLLALNTTTEGIGKEADSFSQWLQTQEDNLKSAIDTVQGTLATLAALGGANRSFLDDLGTTRPSEIARSVLQGAWTAVRGVWRYELTSVDDRPITVGKIISALILLSIGLWLSRSLSVALGRTVLPRLGLRNGGLMAIQSILFYLLVVFFALAALQIVNVPLTFFTFIGGALAIGVGFGSQNIMSNFISGLIMLVEQHVRVGDLIEVNNLQGTVKHVGPRSTIIRTGDNIDIVVPNSSFLDKHVVNWTLADNMIRLCVEVGVSYEAPVQLVTNLLLQAAEENLHVLSNPKPAVFFSSFGDHTINFQLYCSVFIGSILSAAGVKSELRYRIFDLFREHHIDFAYPQRDVHLEVEKPVVIKIADGSATGKGS